MNKRRKHAKKGLRPMITLFLSHITLANCVRGNRLSTSSRLLEKEAELHPCLGNTVGLLAGPKCY